MKPYRYHINFGPYGAELIAGSLDQNQIDYWSKQTNQKLRLGERCNVVSILFILEVRIVMVLTA